MAFDFETFEAGLESLMIEPYELGYVDDIEDKVDAALEAYYYDDDDYYDEDDIGEEGVLQSMKDGVRAGVGKVKDFKREHTYKQKAIPNGEIKAQNFGAKITKLVNSLMNQIDKLIAKLESMARSRRGNRTIYLTKVAEKAFNSINKKDGSKMEMNQNGKVREKKLIFHKDVADDALGNKITPEAIRQSYQKVQPVGKYKHVTADECLAKINGLRATARNLKTRIANLKNNPDDVTVQTTSQLITRLNNDANIIRTIMQSSDTISAGTLHALPNVGQRDTIGMKQTGKKSKVARQAIR